MSGRAVRNLPPFFAAGVLAGCVPSGRLAFPPAPVLTTETGRYYDVDRDGRVDFGLEKDGDGRPDLLVYDDDQDGRFDRVYRLSDYRADRVPHLILLVDSVPYRAMAEAHAAGRLPFFDAPRKVIAPFPTMSGLIFTRLLGAPPTPGMINRHYDRRRGRVENRIVKRVFGWRYPWQRRLHYHPDYGDNGLMFLKPRRWYPAELARVRDVLERSGDRVTIAYMASTSGLLSKYGADSLDEIVDGLERLSMQLLYERNGAVEISIVSDHGHNLVPPKRISLDETLREHGFRPADRLRNDRDVVYDIDGLVNYVGLHTRRAAEVAAALATRPEVELVAYVDGERVIVRDGRGTAAVDRRRGRFRYSPLDADVLDYGSVSKRLIRRGATDADGFAADRAWFEATIDHEWPDALRRLWDAFHGAALNTPQVMVTMRDGYCVGLGFFDIFIDMASTHGGLDQADSAAFVMTTTGRIEEPLRTGDVMGVLEPDYDPSFRPRAD